MSLTGAARAVLRTGLLHSAPLGALWQAVRVLARHGGSLYAVAAWSAARFPDAAALVEHDEDEAEGGRVTTFRELFTSADLIADALAARVPPGGAVGLLGRNHVTFVATLLAAQRQGLRVVLLNPRLPARETLVTCRAQRVRLLVADDEFAASLGAPDSTLPCWRTSEVAALRRQGVRRTRAPWRRGQLVLLSSGSTGAARALRRQVRPREAPRLLGALLGGLRLRAHAPTLLTVPLFHGQGLSTLALSLTMAAPLHLFARGSAEAYLRVLERAGIEVLVLVPTVLYRLLGTPGAASLPRLRAVVCGSAPLGGALATRALSRFGPVLYNLYGTSEWGLISLASPEQLLAAPDSVGRVLPGVRLDIVRPDGASASPGEIGEVTLRGVGAGDGVRTGDLGCLSASGWLTLVGRRDDLLVIGGEKVYPEVVEARIARLAGVRECAVAGVPDAEYGTRLVTFVVLEGQEGGSIDAVARDLAGTLPRAMRPVRVVIVETLPRNAMGKLVRRLLPIPADLRAE